MAVLVLAAVAPAVALDYGINSSLIGYQISLISFGMMLTLTLLGNTSKRYGAARTNQIGHAFIASGILILLTPWLPFLIVSCIASAMSCMLYVNSLLDTLNYLQYSKPMN